LGVIEKGNYYEEVNKLMTKKRKKGGRSLPVPKKRIQERGRKFISIVLRNSKEHHITNSEMLDYLSIKTRHVESLRSLVSE